MAWPIPDDLVPRMRDRAPDEPGGLDGATWLRKLPALVEERLAAWDLRVTGPARNGHNALVLPVARDDRPLVLKVTWPHHEARTEHLALRHWDGRGSVRLVAAQPSSFSLLLEGLGPRDLTAIDDDAANTVIGGLLARLHVPGPSTVPTFAEETAARLPPLRAHPVSIPRRWIDRALEVFDHRAFEPVLLHVDLHQQNVLESEREAWLAIDPKPLTGPGAFDLYPALRNQVDVYGEGAGFRDAVRRRLDLLTAASGIDADEARDWCVARAVLDAYEFGAEGWTGLTTLNLAIAKAVDDF